jgi:hypothetical protein
VKLFVFGALLGFAASACGGDDGTSSNESPGGAGVAGSGTWGSGGQGTGGASITGGAAGSAGGAGAGSGGALPASPCEVIAPDPGGSAVANRAKIQSCLDTEKRALLLAGTFPISTGLVVPPGAVLKGVSTERPTLVLQPESGADVTNFMITLAGGAPVGSVLSHLRIDANDAIGNLANASTLMVTSDGATVDDVEILNAQQAPHDYTAAAVYFICGDCSGNVVSNIEIHNHYYGVIFQAALTGATSNRIEKSHIHDIRCDAVTFAGYGEAVDNQIHDAGWDCNNGPIPGGGFYALNNPYGAKIHGNDVWNTCGTPLDIDSTDNLDIQNNHFHDPGYRWNGLFPYCSGAAATLIDTSHSLIKHNVFENSGPHNSGGNDPNQVTHATGAPLFSDLPAGQNAVFAFGLLSRPNATNHFTVGNTITENQFSSYQAPSTGKVGIGAFTSRNTGFDPSGWSAATTNYFTDNHTFGSNVGSVRCGGNWFAGSSNCPAGAGAPCNDDDYQHTAANFHSDACAQY